jgi:cell division ATPase FtsA
VNETAEITRKDVHKIIRAKRMIEQILAKVPPELKKMGFDSEAGRRAVAARWAKARARKAESEGPEAA